MLPGTHLKVMLFAILFSFLVTPSFSARILGIVPSPSYSHQIVFRPLWKELSLKGHQLTVLTTNPMNDPNLKNLTEIDLQSSYEIWNKFSMFDMSQLSVRENVELGLKISDTLLDHQLQHPEVQKLLKNESEHFDVLLIEALFPTMYTFSERFKCPFIQITTFESSSSNYFIIGNPPHPVLNPDVMLPFTEDLTFFERLQSVAYLCYLKYFGIMHFYPTQQPLIEKHFGNKYPPLQDIVKKVSMMFVNTSPLFHQIRPLVPAVVQVGGGTHFRTSQPTPLPKDLQIKLDNAPGGFIYFSLGSNVRSKDFSEPTRNILLETFGELPYTVLWKFELEDMPGKPENVIISKWFPQQAVFRHPNIKLFITQGGLQSMEEAVYNHIPIVGMPFFGDQPTNIKRMVAKGLGLAVDHKTIDKASFRNTILEVIKTPKYRNRVKELADLATDEPMTGLERAVWWTEYVLRHKGAKHLRSPAMDIPYYQYFLLDVIGFSLLVLLVTLCLLLIVIKLIVKLVKYFLTKPKLKVQ